MREWSRFRLYGKFRVSSALLLLGAAFAMAPVLAKSIGPDIAGAQAALRLVSAPSWEPRHKDPDARIEATGQARLDGWYALVTFRWDWATSAWTVVQYAACFEGIDPPVSGCPEQVSEAAP